ncbi:MAG: AAA family ATPase [Deltaproteobacteria bacterium]|nr:AAA family ATPase [Deltaproteobacteria bacterium]
MRVTRLEIFGFKSFMDRLVLPLNAGITGVVGPNGCGKSNIVDAVRWVLGESHAKNLRGAVSEDVIFNGTEELRPLGLAEVSITLAAQDKEFFDDIVAPGLEVENIIDSIDLEDEPEEQELEQEEGNSEPKRLSVVPDREQEEGEEEAEKTVLEKKPNLEVLDGGASSSSLADKFSWLKSASEVQVTRRLYRSGESEYFINRVPCRRKDIVELFRAVGMGARTYNIVAQGEISRIITAKPDEKRHILEEAAGVLGFRDKIASANRRLKETEVNISRIDDIIKEVSRQVSSLKRQASKARNRESLVERIREIESALFADRYIRHSAAFNEVKVLLDKYQREEQEREVSLQKLQAEEHQLRSQLMTIDVESDSLRSKMDSIREDLNNRERARHAQRARLLELKALEAASETETRKLEERQRTLHERQEQCSESIVTLEKSEAELTAEIMQLETYSGEDLKQAATKLDACRAELRQKEHEIRTEREKLVAVESKAASLEEQIESSSPATRLKETLGTEGQEFVEKSIGLLVDGLQVPEAYTTAVQAILAEHAGFLVAEDAEELAKAFINKVFDQGTKGNVSPALGVFQAGNIQSPIVHKYAEFCTSSVKPILEVIEVDLRYSYVATQLLSEVYVANNLDAAYEFVNKLPNSADAVVVTLEGDIVSPHSFFSFRYEGGLVKLKNRSLECQQIIADLTKTLEKLSEEKKVLQQSVTEAESKHQEALRESQQRASQVKDLSQRQGSARGRLDSEKRVLGQIKQDSQRTAFQLREVANKISKLQDEQRTLQAEISDEITDEEKQLQKELDQFSSKLSEVERRRKSGREELSESSRIVEKSRSELDKARTETSRATLKLQKEELEIQHVKEMVINELSADAFESIQKLSDEERENILLSDEQRKEHQDEVQRIKTRIMREGEVDPTSIERCEEETQRLEELETQKKDLEEAHRTLRKTIDKLSQISEQRFLQTFEAVNTNFSQLVPKLFGGGKAHLELLDPENPLESGVEIIARPPGKKLKSIELLSGGEKTLCAIALIIGMFLERPSPVCVLDEVDAPLDEANVGRFLNLVKEMSTTTQFIVITHNKTTMSVSDRLVGVTMEQPGASTIVTVSLEEAYSHAVND